MKKTRVTPSEGRQLFKVVASETKIIDASGGRAQTVASTEAEDRDGDVIRQKGWILDYFIQHPVLIASHNYGDLTCHIGEWEDMTIKGKKLVGVAKYYIGEGNPQADWGFKIAQFGRAAYSVGFIPLEWKERDPEDMQRPSYWGGYEFTKQELMEVSHVTIPSNPEALQLMAKSSIVHPELRSIAKTLLSNDREEIEEKMEHGICYMPGCEKDAGTTMPICKGCTEKMMKSEDFSSSTSVQKPKGMFIVPDVEDVSVENNADEDIVEEKDMKLDISELLISGKTVKFNGTVSPDGNVELEAVVVEDVVSEEVETDSATEEAITKEVESEEVAEDVIEDTAVEESIVDKVEVNEEDSEESEEDSESDEEAENVEEKEVSFEDILTESLKIALAR